LYWAFYQPWLTDYCLKGILSTLAKLRSVFCPALYIQYEEILSGSPIRVNGILSMILSKQVSIRRRTYFTGTLLIESTNSTWQNLVWDITVAINLAFFSNISKCNSKGKSSIIQSITSIVECLLQRNAIFYLIGYCSLTNQWDMF